jgi:transposase-like protein
MGASWRFKLRTRRKYSKEFKNSMVLKVLNRGDLTIAEVCEREGMSVGSVTNWLGKNVIVPEMKNQYKKWSAEEKLEALIQTGKMEETELGVYLRQEGLHSHRLHEWRSDALKSLDGALARPQKLKKDDRDVKIAELERNLLRKDRALAEASALLILQKKVHLIWEQSEGEKK